mmetsp:Transcript_11324/g.13472  ORF Transcript_11324/g.13472 Transcript_11324/m.13472 type:complete len:84 (-) Transcript_11324:186-437(-)
MSLDDGAYYGLFNASSKYSNTISNILQTSHFILLLRLAFSLVPAVFLLSSFLLSYNSLPFKGVGDAVHVRSLKNISNMIIPQN